MARNIEQVFLANPITVNQPLDLMYFGQSPYGTSNDAAMTFADFSEQMISAGIAGQIGYYASNGSLLSPANLVAGTGISIGLVGNNYTLSATGAGLTTTVSGTINQVLVNGTVATPESGALVLTLPQDIATTSSPVFTGITAGNLNLTANTLSTINSNGNLIVSPNGSGSVFFGNTIGVTINSNIPLLQQLGSGTVGQSQSVIGRFSNNSIGPTIYGLKSRATSVGSHGAVTSGDILLSLIGVPDDGTSYVSIGANAGIFFQVAGTVSTGIVPVSIGFNTVNTSGSSLPALILNPDQSASFTNNILLGSSGTAGSVTSFPGTALSGSLKLSAANNSGNFANILTNASTSAARIWTLPDATGTLALVGSTVSSITGTANQVIASASTGAITLSTPQDIATGSSPTFTGLTAGNLNLASNSLISTNTNANITIAPNGSGSTIVSSTFIAGSGAYVAASVVPFQFTTNATFTVPPMTIGMWANNAVATGINFVKNRNTNLASFTTVQNGDALLQLDSYASGTTGLVLSSQIKVVVNGTVGASAIPTQMTLSTMTTGGTLTTGLTISNAQVVTLANALPVGSGGTGITSFGTGVATALGTNVNGSGAFALTTSPTFVTPVLGAASATSINFGGTALSTYVEGTFTPVLNFGGVNTGITYAVQLGAYVQIGKVVHVTISITLTSKGAAAGTATISGFPVAARNTANLSQVFPIYCDSLTYTSSPIGASLTANSTAATLISMLSANPIQVISNTAFSNTSTIYICTSYLV